LFHKAIAESGAGAWVADRERAAAIANLVLDKLPERPRDIETLQALPVADLFAAQPGAGVSAGGTGAGLTWQPVIDGEVLTRTPLDAVQAGHAAGVHLLTGTNEHEVTLFQVLDPSLADLDDEGVLGLLASVTDRPAPLLAAYRELMPEATSREVWSALATDAAFRMPAVRLASAQHEHGAAWMYRFTWETPVFGGALRSTHALEIPFVFDNLDQPGADQFTGDGPERAAIADAMHRAWITFARTGDPGWPAYEPGRRATQRFDTDLEILDDPDAEQRRAWERARA
jgi:para-nitrobenzyl esterase